MCLKQYLFPDRESLAFIEARRARQVSFHQSEASPVCLAISFKLCHDVSLHGLFCHQQEWNQRVSSHSLPVVSHLAGFLSSITQLCSASNGRQAPANQAQEYLPPRFSQTWMLVASHGCEGPRRALSLRQPRSKCVNMLRQFLLLDTCYSHSFSFPHITSHQQHLSLQSPHNWLIVKCQPKQQNLCSSRQS